MKPVIGIDLDGTILDCRVRQEAVLLDMVPQAEPALDVLWSLKRGGLSTRQALSQLGVPYGQNFSAEWLSRIESVPFIHLDPPLPGSIDALAALQGSARLHLITARRNKSGLTDTVDRLGLGVYFDEIVIVPSGPDAAMRKADQLRTSHALGLCGDTEVDGDAAMSAQTAFWAVSSGQRSAEYLAKRTRPACLLPSLHEFAAAFPDMLHRMVSDTEDRE